MFLWDVTSGPRLRRFRGHEGGVNAVAFAGENDAVLVAPVSTGPCASSTAARDAPTRSRRSEASVTDVKTVGTGSKTR